MQYFQNVREALEYVDGHLDEPVNFELLAKRFHLSPYYFHRIFSAVVGKSVAAYIRDRRLEHACLLLVETGLPVIEVCMACGYGSAQSFSRAFRKAYGLSPSAYRQTGHVPSIVTVEELVRKFTNRLRGGILVEPKMIKKGKLLIAGITGDANNTGGVWQEFERRSENKAPQGQVSGNGYEIRIYDGAAGKVHVGVEVSAPTADYETVELPASQYASFEVYVADGYDSENDAMNEWLQSNGAGYVQRFLNGSSYVVEYYDERFAGEEAGSIVEIWVPVEKAR